MTSPIDRILSSLANVKGPDGIGNYYATCPAHESKSRRKDNLTVRQGDRLVILHCFAGCRAEEILKAIGMQLSDLYPPRDRNQPRPTRRRKLRRWTIDEREAAADVIATTAVLWGIRRIVCARSPQEAEYLSRATTFDRARDLITDLLVADRVGDLYERFGPTLKPPVRLSVPPAWAIAARDAK